MDRDDLDFDSSDNDKPAALSWKPREVSRRKHQKASFGQKLGSSDPVPSSSRRGAIKNGHSQTNGSSNGLGAHSCRPNPLKASHQDPDDTVFSSRSRLPSKKFGRSDRPMSFASSPKKAGRLTGIRASASASSSDDVGHGLTPSWLCDSEEGHHNIFTDPLPCRSPVEQKSHGSTATNVKPPPTPGQSNGNLAASQEDEMLSSQSLSVPSSISRSTKPPARSRGGSTQSTSDVASSSQETMRRDEVSTASLTANSLTESSSPILSRPSKASGSKVANSTRRKRARHEEFRRRSGWLSDEDSPAEEYETKSTKRRKNSSTALDSDKPAMHRFRLPVARVTGVRFDAYAGGNAGSTQCFRDEVLRYCSTIVGPNVKERLQAATALAIRMSDTSTYSVDSIVHEDVTGAFVQLLSFCKNLAVEEQSRSNADDGIEEADGQVKRFVVMILHYLSLLCCDEQQKRTRSRLHISNAAHRALRKSFVSASSALQGVVCLVLADPRVAKIRGKSRRVGALLGPDFDCADGAAAEHDCSQSTLASSVASTPESVGHSQAASSTVAAGSNGTNDPTRAGRLRRAGKRRAHASLVDAKLSPIFEARPNAKKALDFDEFDELGFPGNGNGIIRGDGTLSFKDDGSGATAQQKLDALLKRISRVMDDALVEHSCGTEADVLSELIPLLALSRVMTGKLDGNLHSVAVSTSSEKEIATFATQREEEDDAVIRDDHLLGGSGMRFWDESLPGNESDAVGEDHPFQVGNRALAESGVVSLLAVAIADTLSAVVRLLNRECRKGRRQKPVCVGCLSHLRERLRMLVSIVDVSCLFCDENRVMFCQGGHSDDLGGYLIVGLVSVLSAFCDAEQTMFAGAWADIVLETLRLLLTLTHENETAARELEIALPKKGESGLSAISRVLYASCNQSKPDSADNKHKYDCSIFCLNIFTNYLESGGSFHQISELQLPTGRAKGKGAASRSFLSWVSSWLVGQTSTFRDAVMESSFGSSPSKHSSRTLEGSEEEKLLMAGNGFVMLAWILVEDESGSISSKSKVREMIEAELPGSDTHSKRTYLRNTLKAFCNFYHASVGDMSVMVVEPVKKLINKLDGRPS